MWSNVFKSWFHKSYCSLGFTCLNNTIFGNGQVNEIVVAECKLDEVGQKIAICQENGSFSVLENNCVLKEIEHLFLLSQVIC